MTDRKDERQHERQQDGREQAARTPAEQADDQEGQVSEVGNLDRADEPISDDQAVAGDPDPDVDEGPTGPNARSGSNRN